MTEKERFLGTLLGGDADRFPFFDLEPAEDTIERWHTEGLPRNTSVAEFFHLEPHHQLGVEIRSAPFYRGAPDLLDDPAAFARHYDIDDPDRFPSGWADDARRAHREGRVVVVNASGGGLLQMLGVGGWDSLVAACRALIERPRHVEELIERTVDFHCQCLDRALSQVHVDYASLYEPIASNVGPVVSPAAFERFSMPGYRRILDLLDGYQIPLRVMCTTGGDLSSLLPPLVDAGINGFWISNITNTRMQYSALREEYGADIALIGGVDSTAMSESDAVVSRIVHETVPPLLESGRYLPCLDDRPRSNVPFSRYAHYREVLREIADRS
jgi:hypothetical protein